MQIVAIAEVPTTRQSGDSSLRTGGTVRQTLLTDSTADGLNFRFIRSQYQGGDAAFESPRHHHAFQQIRFTEAGSVNYAPGHDIPQGDIAYFPRGVYYGPQRKDHGTGLLLQLGFHGEHQSGPHWTRHRAAALEHLIARGRLDGGIYYERDEDTGQEMARDANHALYEEQYFAQTGQKFSIPCEGYAEPILMHPAAFEYYPAADGVRIKQLGHFFDHPGPNADIRIGVVELADRASYVFAPDRAQIAWTLDAGLWVEGTMYGKLTCLYSPRDEALTVCADTTAADHKLIEMYVLDLPRLDSVEGLVRR
ncbi:hypothetical protein N7451_008862 [Penicillium sp. IBT 35674x]|nr:hypothetical protein N7451_008862 [Penicillium sp. IBT 35674x]